MAGTRQITVEILGDASSAQKAFGQLDSGTSGLASTLSKGGAAFLAMAAAGGTAAYKLGSDFDDAYDTLRVGTGATGERLDALKDSFRNVVKNVPTDFGSASDAITELSRRTELTGNALETMSKQQLQLARITKSDLNSNIAATTRVFGDWGIATKDQSAAMDKMFRASQQTGIGIDRLASSAVQFGAPLRAMGFGFDQTVALLGKFEKEGVNAELVMGAMRKGLAAFAKTGEDAPAALARLTKEIKDAESPTKATALAMEVFGSKAGPDMSAAIREGRFDLADLFDTVSNGSDTILDAAEDTADFAEKWQMLKNRALVGLEPLAIKVFDAVGDGMTKISKIDLSPAQARVKGFLNGIEPDVTSFVDKLRDGIASGGQKLIDGVKIGIDTGDWAPLGNSIGTAAANALEASGDAAGKMFGAMSKLISKVDWGGLAYEFGKQAPTLVLGLAVGILSFDIGSALQFVGDHWLEILIGIITTAFTPLKVIRPIAGILGKIPLVGPLIEWATLHFKSFSDDIFGKALNAMDRMATGFLDGLGLKMPAVFGRVGGNLDDLVLRVWYKGDDLLRSARQFVGKLPEGILNGLESVGSAGGRVIDAAVRSLTGFSTREIFDAGRRLIQGFIDGIVSKFGDVKGKLGELTNKLPEWKGPPAKDAQILYGSGRLVLGGFMSGVESQVPSLRSQLAGITSELASSIGIGVGTPDSRQMSLAGAGGGGSVSITYGEMHFHGTGDEIAAQVQKMLVEHDRQLLQRLQARR